MNTVSTFLIIAVLCVTFGAPSLSQGQSLNGRSAVAVKIGLWGGAKAATIVRPAWISTEAGTNGFVGGIEYSYWLREHIALTFDAGVLSASATSTTIVGIRSAAPSTSTASAVVPVLLGLRFYVPAPAPDENIRPFVSVAVGSYFGSEASNADLAQESRTETAIGGRAGVGVDFILGTHIKLGFDLGYHVMADYSAPIGARTNYNGAAFSLGIGFIL